MTTRELYLAGVDYANRQEVSWDNQLRALRKHAREAANRVDRAGDRAFWLGAARTFGARLQHRTVVIEKED